MIQKRRKYWLLSMSLIMALLLIGCQQEETQPKETVDDDSQMYGVIEEALPDYHLTECWLEEDYPRVYESDGQYGFKDKNGEILVPAEYDGAREFYRGYGELYQDETAVDGTSNRHWFHVSPTGKVMQFDYVQGFFGDKDLTVSIAKKDNKYGVVNTEFDFLIPLEYDFLTLAYDYEQELWASYGKKDNQWVQFDLRKGLLRRFEPYEERRAADYSEVIDLSQYRLTIVDNNVIVDGILDRLGSYFPLNLLDGREFDIYENGKDVQTKTAVLTEGAYEGELMVVFDESPEKWHNDYFAVFHGANPFPRPVTTDNNLERYETVVQDFLTNRQIENSPYKIMTVLTGDFRDDGKTGVVFSVADSLLDEENSFREQVDKEFWPPEKFAEERSGVFTAVIYLPDDNDLTHYEVLREAVYQEAKITNWVYYDVLNVAQLYDDSVYEVIITRLGYEFLDMAIAELPTK